jgi:hypothetical protein
MEQFGKLGPSPDCVCLSERVGDHLHGWPLFGIPGIPKWAVHAGRSRFQSRRCICKWVQQFVKGLDFGVLPSSAQGGGGPELGRHSGTGAEIVDDSLFFVEGSLRFLGFESECPTVATASGPKDQVDSSEASVRAERQDMRDDRIILGHGGTLPHAPRPERGGRTIARDEH